jgi:hypothetical protein
MRISWDDLDHIYFSGVSNGVLYPQNSPGVAWAGLISVTENADATPVELFMDGQKYHDRLVPTPYSGTISAFMYPDEFEPYNGVVDGFTAQPRQPFGFSFRDNRELHIVYNAQAEPSSDQYQTIGDTTSLVAFAWNFATIPVDIDTSRPTSHLVVALDYADPDAVAALEAILYGDDSNDPSIPDPQTVIDLFESFTTVRVTVNGDGTFTVSGPDSAVFQIDSTTWEINWPSVFLVATDTYIIYSL